MIQKILTKAFLIFLFGCWGIVSGQNETGEKKYSIENCVNIFDSTKTQKTDAGFQYWFADKNFIDGRTLKMSVVAPHKATHAPHVHAEDEFSFLCSKERRNFISMGKQKSPVSIQVFIARRMLNMELKMLAIRF